MLIVYNTRWGETKIEQLGRYLKKMSYIRGCYDADINKEAKQFREKVIARWETFGKQIESVFQQDSSDSRLNTDRNLFSFNSPIIRIPEHGWTEEQLFSLIQSYSDITLNNIKDKQLTGTIYSDSLTARIEDSNTGQKISEDDKLRRVFTRAFEKSYLWNSLHEDEFGIGSYIEYQVVQMVAHMFGCTDPKTVAGFVTSGGTESLMLAMRSYRNWGMMVKGHGPGESVILAAKSVHAAVFKAGMAYLMKVITIDTDDQGRLDLHDLQHKLRKYGNKVVVVVGSTPSYPTGVIDPITEMAKIAHDHGCGLHVDCCLGGFIINNIHTSSGKLKYNINYLAIPGVTSISADTHKNGLAPKGSSVLVTKCIGLGKNLKYYSIYSIPDWSGGVYGTPKDSGSQSCVPALTALLAMLATGVEGYTKMADSIHETSLRLAEIINEFKEDFTLVANPEVNVVAFRLSKNAKLKKGAIYAFAHEMAKRNFIFNTLNGEIIHFCVTMRFVNHSCALNNFKYAMIEALNTTKELNNKLIEEGKEFSGDAGMYCALDAATTPKISELSYRKYLENKLLGRAGAQDAIREYFLALSNPY
ncbi:Pyridoxal-dependent decarboxylase [uncultured virus]|nr:Pyridoxal-dependent decarboxylase [uncultured virus]